MLDARRRLRLRGLKDMFGGTAWVNEASKLYQRAGNMLRTSENWTKAGDCFIEVVKLSVKYKTSYDVATNLDDAVSCYRNDISIFAIEPLNQLIEIYTETGRFIEVAKRHQALAEIYELDGVGHYSEKCYNNYQKAVHFFGEDFSPAAIKCRLKVARYAAEMKDYEKAISFYDQMATASLESSLPDCNAKDCFFKALLCHLCIDVSSAKNALTRYQEMHPDFQDTRECRLVQCIFTHLEEQNLDAFTETAFEFDSVSRLDTWTAMMLNRIKTFIKEDLR